MENPKCVHFSPWESSCSFRGSISSVLDDKKIFLEDDQEINLTQMDKENPCVN